MCPDVDVLFCFWDISIYSFIYLSIYLNIMYIVYNLYLFLFGDIDVDEIFIQWTLKEYLD